MGRVLQQFKILLYKIKILFFQKFLKFLNFKMISPSTKLFDDLVEISKSDIKFIDLLRPFFQEKYSVDIYDLLFHDLNSMDTNVYSNGIPSDNPILHASNHNFFEI